MADNPLEDLPRFPQDGPIRTALEAKNLKKAIQLIDKRTKTVDKVTEYLMVSIRYVDSDLVLTFHMAHVIRIKTNLLTVGTQNIRSVSDASHY